MTLQEIFDQLTTGELSKLAIGGSDHGGVQPSDYSKVVNHINLGLTDLHSRFNLKEGRAVLTLALPKRHYTITGKDPSVVLLDETGADFGMDLLKLESVLHPDGSAYGLNEKNNPFSMSTPSPTTLRLPDQWKDGQIPAELTLVYRADHPKIDVVPGFDPQNVWVELPHSHLWALLLFVASRAHNPVGMSNEFHAGNSYFAKYLAACQDLVNQNLHVDHGNYNDRLQSNGWV